MKKYLLTTTLMAALVIAAGCQKKPEVAQSTGTAPAAPAAQTEHNESTNPNQTETGQYHDTTRGTQGQYQPSAQDQMYNRENQPSTRQNPSGLQ